MAPVRCVRTAAALLLYNGYNKKNKKRRRFWVRDWILRREKYGAYNKLIRELKIEDAQQFKNFIRMSAVDFEELLSKVGRIIQKEDTHLRASISPSERLMVTLRFLATGDSHQSLMYLFRIPACTMSGFIPQVCSALYQELKDTYLKIPLTKEEWLGHSKKYLHRWNFPHCIGALDGKHIVMQAPKNSGSYYYNYKNTHSIVLLALVDASYTFTYVDVGCNGRISDSGVFNNCTLSSALMNNELDLPQPSPLSGREKPMPYVIVADDAFPMKSYLMKPFPYKDQPGPNRVFNYLLSRARRIVENAFGIIANTFRILRKPILLEPEKVKKIVLAICTLHNFLMKRKDSAGRYAPAGSFDTEDEDTHAVVNGSWRRDSGTPTDNLLPLQRCVQQNYSTEAKLVCNEFKEYFISVNWQYKYI
ncbi:uncharacterized protein LOC111692469 [Anoplophora glabripennis]|uniref:uncharacterized protein LOC111692469 n=1 Tax=Anoplophora glabripennis TaxID=217634 RepID=UPI000A1370A5|nr:uncharacterized protein LOC111692469 [Anoplophora glabripennis]